MKQCKRCIIYKTTSGRGARGCLSCYHYKLFQRASITREKLPIEDMAQALLDNLEDKSAYLPDIITVVRQMPVDYALILAAHYVSHLSISQIADALRASPRTISRRLKDAEALLGRMYSKVGD
jgi:DNA-directed RNA polymerase specialized sigma24 family protein